MTLLNPPIRWLAPKIKFENSTSFAQHNKLSVFFLVQMRLILYFFLLLVPAFGPVTYWRIFHFLQTLPLVPTVSKTHTYRWRAAPICHSGSATRHRVFHQDEVFQLSRGITGFQHSGERDSGWERHTLGLMALILTRGRFGYGRRLGFQIWWLHCTVPNMFTLHRPRLRSLLPVSV